MTVVVSSNNSPVFAVNASYKCKYERVGGWQ